MEIKTFQALVIGSGAAGFNAACRLKELGVEVALVTEGVNRGTSRNTGSDKQTYYKLGLGGDSADSVGKMAQDLFDGGCVDGDNALCEAALSSRCFLHLCELGVEFPVNRYGEYVGYKTDHDPCARATSAGPLTSKYMTQALERKAHSLGIPVLDECYAARLLKNGDAVCGVLCIRGGKPLALRCANVILATGGPAGIYADSVYPACHAGSSGLALLAGAKMQNLALWQYGLASVCPRWNVSGTYMQVLPRFVSIDTQGVEHDFLWEHYADRAVGLSAVFMKGYQWPFDPQKAENGSSVIDLLVHRERVEKNRRVYLDFTRNPCPMEYSRLSEEAYTYLCRADATFGTPIERLEKMNALAVALYKSKGVDLHTEYLEIALCAQHHNGGIAVDLWWQSSVPGLFAIGECAGTHGIRRPGGSALNAGQVGGLRAAQYIARHPRTSVDEETFRRLAEQVPLYAYSQEPERLHAAQRRMSDCAAAVRDPAGMENMLQRTLEEWKTATDPHLVDVLAMQAAVLHAMLQPLNDPTMVQQVQLTEAGFAVNTRPVRPIPSQDSFFENVWRGYRENKNIF